MKKFLPFLLILAACSSNPTSKRNLSSDTEELSWVDELDFTPTKEEAYRGSSDEFNTSGKDEKLNSLAKESVALMSPARLDTLLKDNKDELMSINLNCYLSNFDKAFEIADRVYEKYKSNTSYWNQIGTCYYLNGDASKAILFYNKSHDLDKKYVPALNNLGVVYEKQGRFQKALAAYKMASDTNQFALTPTYNLARLYLKFGTVGKAYPIFNALYKKSGEDVDLAQALATANLVKGEYQQAIDIYSRIDKKEVSAPEISLNYALALKFAGKKDEALKVLNQMANPLGEIVEYAKKVENFVRN